MSFSCSSSNEIPTHGHEGISAFLTVSSPPG